MMHVMILSHNVCCNAVASPAKASTTDSSSVSDATAALAISPVQLQQQGALLGQVGNWVTWVKQNTMAVFQPPHRELPAEEVELREVRESGLVLA
jgi:hypothetical protein